MRYSNLWLISITPEQHAKTCGYWYLVQNDHSAHTAFKRRDALLRWLAERGLEMTGELPAQGEHSTQKLKGQYETRMHGSYDEFYALQGRKTRVMSNGEYTLGVITDDGTMKTVHSLNPNCRERPKFDYFATDAAFN